MSTHTILLPAPSKPTRARKTFRSTGSGEGGPGPQRCRREEAPEPHLQAKASGRTDAWGAADRACNAGPSGALCFVIFISGRFHAMEFNYELDCLFFFSCTRYKILYPRLT